MATVTTTVVEFQEPPRNLEQSKHPRPVLRELPGTPSVSRAASNPPTSPPSPAPSARRIFNAAQPKNLSPSSRFFVIFFIVAANLSQFIINFLTFSTGFYLTNQLGRHGSPSESTWMAASYSLTQGSFVLVSGRLGAIYGHQPVLMIGGAIMTLFTLLSGFSTNFEMMVAMRALTGIGGGMVTPNAVAILTMMVPPGRTRNITMSMFGAAAPTGGWLGALFSGLFVQYTSWRYLFYFSAALTAAIFIGLYVLIPREIPVDKGGKIDYLGAFLGVSSLMLFNFVWNQAPSVGWQTASEIGCLILSLVMFTGFLVWESKFAAHPIMPLTIFRAPTFTALIFVVLLSYMSFGISLWYMLAWQELLRGWTVLEVAWGWIPFGIGANAAVLLAAWLMPRLAAQWIMAIGVVATLITNLLLATMPEQQNYWAQVFPATLISSICPDFVYVAAQLIASNSVSRKQQGIAGSLIGTLNLYGNSLGLGFAGLIETEVAKYPGATTVYGYRAALLFGFALAVVGLALDFAWVRMPKDEREGWNEDEADATAVELVVPVAATGVDTSERANASVALA
ncbi:MFS general substrate transporter [Thozetella sp. PMI_491]|nr:MFS general substrate transporter [Thozetella sp. PMI_491]